tara:strand:- start:341 stop:874 length:534 start_codon:yes stop_codon:yes gene_type:complete
MNVNELGAEVYEILTRITYARKVNQFDESTVTQFTDLADEIKAAVKSFPVLHFDDDIDLMDIDTLDGEQQFYVFHNTTAGGYFLVDTQGYNYPRYITRLWGFMKEETDDQIDDTFQRMDGLVRIADVTILTSVVKSLAFDLEEEGFTRVDIMNFLDAQVHGTLLLHLPTNRFIPTTN